MNEGGKEVFSVPVFALLRRGSQCSGFGVQGSGGERSSVLSQKKNRLVSNVGVRSHRLGLRGLLFKRNFFASFCSEADGRPGMYRLTAAGGEIIIRSCQIRAIF